MAGGVAGESTNVDEAGNFSISVLRRAVERSHGLELLSDPSLVEAALRSPTENAAYVLNHHAHWFTVRKLHGTYWDLNSTRAFPTKITDFYLAAYLAQMQSDGYSIFVVRPADKLPPPPKDRSMGASSSFHTLASLRAAEERAVREARAAQASTAAQADTDPQLAAALEASRAAAEGRPARFASPTTAADEEEAQLQSALRASLGQGGAPSSSSSSSSSSRLAPSPSRTATAEELAAVRAMNPGLDDDTLTAIALSLRAPSPARAPGAAASRSPASPMGGSASHAAAGGGFRLGGGIGSSGASAGAATAPPAGAGARAPPGAAAALGKLEAAATVLLPVTTPGPSTRVRITPLAPSGAPAPHVSSRVPLEAPAAGVLAWAWLQQLAVSFPGLEAEPCPIPSSKSHAAALVSTAAAQAAEACRVVLNAKGTPGTLEAAVQAASPTLPGGLPTVADANFKMQQVVASPRPEA